MADPQARLLPEVAMGTTIPKRVVQAFFSAGRLPDPLRANIAAMSAVNPGWTFDLYDDADIESFIRTEYGEDMLAYYWRIDPSYGAARADFFRYLIIYRQGGVYLDIKSRFLRPIDDVLLPDDRFIVSRWRNGAGEVHDGYGMHGDIADLPRGELQQWHIISVAGHPFLRAVILRMLGAIDRYRPWRDDVGKLGVLRLTGPILYTRAITPLLRDFPCRQVTDETDLALEYSAFAGGSHKRFLGKHYTANQLPVVRLDGVAQMLSAGFCKANLPAIKRRTGDVRRKVKRLSRTLVRRIAGGAVGGSS